MTDRSVLIWLHEVLGVGTLRPKTVKGRRKDGTKYLKQYKWRCTFRDAYQVCLLIWPFAHTKLPKIQQIIEHYSTEKLKEEAVGVGGKDCFVINNVVNLDKYRKNNV
jgi:hypothetical protein